MSAKTTKKRRGDSHQGGDSATASMAVDDEGDGTTTMAAMLAEMKNHMSSVQNEMNEMRGRLSRMDELEVKCNSLERSMKILLEEQKYEYGTLHLPSLRAIGLINVYPEKILKAWNVFWNN